MDLNWSRVSADLIAIGSRFQRDGAATEKLRSPYLVFDWGTTRHFEQDDLVRRTPSFCWRRAERYDGASPLSALKHVTSTLNSTGPFTGSQCS